MKARSLTIQAPAKLNLFLTVTGRRADGYHLLDSLFVFCDLHDTITITAAKGLELEAPTGLFASLIERDDGNLVLRAARLLQAEAGVAAGARLSLCKHIPVAAGLGGGSADAAAVLRGLNGFWNLDWPIERLEFLAAKLGADVPACVRSMSVLARGIGDALSDTPVLPDFGILLVNPGVSTPTPQVFKAYAKANPVIVRKRPKALPAAIATLDVLVAALSVRGNDLVEAAVAVTPEIAEVLSVLRGLPNVAYASLSGSGATCFALFADQARAVQAYEAIGRAYPAWWSWSGGLKP
jgi:4-diphosphocytidyl-2-C-methyl-D-erythritol kinase